MVIPMTINTINYCFYTFFTFNGINVIGVYTQVSLYIDWIALNATDEPVTTSAPTTGRPSTRTTGNGGITPTIIMTTLRTTSTTYDWGYNFTFPVSSTPSRDPPVHVLLLAALVLWFFMSKN